MIAFSSDAMTPEGRALIQERFGIPVLGRYGAIEALKIGYTCEAEVGYHLHEDLCHVRIVDDEVVLSNLVNRGTILLNYRLGDIASRLEEPCPCGRSFRRLDSPTKEHHVHARPPALRRPCRCRPPRRRLQQRVVQPTGRDGQVDDHDHCRGDDHHRGVR